MTTIAYKNGILAADTQMSRGDEKCFGVQKVFKMQDFLFGFAGSFCNLDPVHTWISEFEIDGRRDPSYMFHTWETIPDFGDSWSIILVDRSGRIWTAGKNNPPVAIPCAFDATGSGSEFAVGAMAAGASAPEAVRIASKYDVYTGGSVIRVSF